MTVIELCGEELDGAVCDRLRGHESPWHEGLDADGNWHSWTHGFPGESLPEGQHVVVADRGQAGDWQVYVNPRGIHRSEEPCNAPDEICPCRIP